MQVKSTDEIVPRCHGWHGATRLFGCSEPDLVQVFFILISINIKNKMLLQGQEFIQISFDGGIWDEEDSELFMLIHNFVFYG